MNFAGRTTAAVFMAVMLLIVCAYNSPAQNMTPDELAAKLQEQYDNTRDLKADFVQVTELKAMRIAREGSGTLLIKKPGLLRYTYTKPDKQEIIVKGEEFVMYLPDARQAVKRRLERAVMDRTPITFLAGLGKITDSFKVGFPDGAFRDADGNYLLELKPKGNGMGVDRIILTADPKDFSIKGFSFSETSGNENAFTLKNVKINRGIKDEVFDLSLPGGVKVIEE